MDAGGDEAPDVLVEGVLGESGVENVNTVWCAGSEVKIALADLLEEREGLAFDAV